MDRKAFNTIMFIQEVMMERKPIWSFNLIVIYNLLSELNINDRLHFRAMLLFFIIINDQNLKTTTFTLEGSNYFLVKWEGEGVTKKYIYRNKYGKPRTMREKLEQNKAISS